MPTAVETPWFTVRDAVPYSRRSESLITQALRDGSLIGHQGTRGGKWLIHREDLDAWIRGEKADVKIPSVTRRRTG